MCTVQCKGLSHHQTDPSSTASNDSNETLDIEKVRRLKRGHGDGSGKRVEPVLLYYVKRSYASDILDLSNTEGRKNALGKSKSTVSNQD